MTTVQLLGRGTYGPNMLMGPGISPLWQFFRAPQAQNSVIIYDDGLVVEQATFENIEIQKPEVHTFILGGTDYRCEVGSFEYEALDSAGYTWREITPADTYSEKYGDVY